MNYNLGTQEKYKHPTLGEITELEVIHIQALREMNSRLDNRDKKMDRIIEQLVNFDMDYRTSYNTDKLEKIIQRLQKFKEREL